MESAESNESEDKASLKFISISLESLHQRVKKIEEFDGKSSLKRLTDNAGAVALFLGLVLSIASLYDVAVTKPHAEKISSITQFNAAVSSAAKVRQELIELQYQTKDPAVILAIQSAAAPIIQNDISTARAILPELADSDVGIPQLMTLISESFNMGDPVTDEFIKRATRKKDASPFLRSEAKRWESRYLFSTGHPIEGREAYSNAVKLLPTSSLANAARAFDTADWISEEFMYGDCSVLERMISDWLTALNSPGISLAQRQQMESSLLSQFEQYQGQHCPMPKSASSLQIVKAAPAAAPEIGG
jgi:hypothetical protein